MTHKLSIVAMVFAVLLCLAAVPALAQEDTPTDVAQGEQAAAQTAELAEGEAPAASNPLIALTASFGAGIVILGAGYGIGRIGSAAVESMARQPEVAGTIQIAMIIAAALIEGVTFFALIIAWVKG